MSNQVMDREAILAHAIAIAAPEERAAFIANACGSDRTLQEEVTKVVAAHFNSNSTHNGSDEHAAPARRNGDRPASPQGSPQAAEAAAIGSYIGPYKVVQPLGEGGRGVVYLADQEHPVRRKVALKVFKADADAQPVLDRYASEHRALSLLDHPNIARVLTVSTVPGPSAEVGGGPNQAAYAGRCYVAMEPVKGTPITRYCDEKRLSLTRRLELFVAVCQAVQHAHHKGVLHGNLKPSNVLVTGTDEHPVPRVIEIGVARQAGLDLEYLSPEQAAGDSDVDNRSDVYALGVLLYELLTGSTPLPRQRLEDAGPAEALRLIRDLPPVPPSQYLREAPDRLAALAAQRQTDPAALIAAVHGELDSVVMQALQKDRARRYETPAALARDVQRYLTDVPVEAHPTSPRYELRKWARRYRRAALLATALVVVLAGAGVVGTALTVWAMRAQNEAQAKTEKAEAKREDAEKAHKALQEQVDQMLASHKSTTSALEQALADEAKAERAARYERDVLAFFQDKVFSAGRSKEFFEGSAFDKNVTLRKALDAAEPKVKTTFAGRPLALAMAREMFGSAYLDLDEPNKAVDEYKEAYALREKVQGPQHADTVACRTNLSRALRIANRTDAASELFNQKSEVPAGKKR